MNRRETQLALLVLGTALLLPIAAPAQSQTSPPRVAILFYGSAESDTARKKAFLQGMGDFGYSNGKNVVVEDRYLEGRNERTAEAIAELLRGKPAVLVVGGSQAVRAARLATSSVPIVVWSMADPVGQGVIASFSRPGGNITGIAILSDLLVGKKLEILLEVLPKAKRFGYLNNPESPVSGTLVKSIEAAAKKLGVELVVFNASSAAGLDATLKGITRQRVDGVVVGQDYLHTVHHEKIANAMIANRVPAIHGYSDTGLMSYAANAYHNTRHSASFVHRILQGAKPGDLPFEQPTQMELFVNLKAAKALGITFPPSVMLRADKVIE